MKLEKRSGGGSAKDLEQSVDKEKKPVVIYIMILFIAAFLLMAWSFASHQRSNTEALGRLQSSVTAMQEVQSLQDQVIALQRELAEARKESEDARKESENAQKELEDIRRELAETQSALEALEQEQSAEAVESQTEPEG